MRRMILGLRPAVAALLACAPMAAAQPIGAVGAVNPATLGEPPAATPRQLVIADPVVSEERIIASENGLAQLMFLDQTTLTVGPNSEVVLDRFVYDPDSGAADVALTLARGALRFVGGRATKTSDATITAPGGVVIGLRGGMLAITSEDDQTRVVLFAGDYARVTAGGQTVVLSRPGAMAVIERNPAAPDGGGVVRYAGVVDAATAGEILGAFTSAGDGGYRAAVAPQAGDAAAAPQAVRAEPVSTRGAQRFDLPVVDDTSVSFDVVEDRPAIPPETSMDYADLVDVPFPSKTATARPSLSIAGASIYAQLSWRTNADLDLVLRLPDSSVVYYANPAASLNDGQTEAQIGRDNLGGVIDVGEDIRRETIVVKDILGDPGIYNFFARGFETIEGGPVPYELTTGGSLIGGTATVTGAVGAGEVSAPVPVIVIP